MSSPSVKPIHVLHGKDAHLRDAARRDVIARAVGDADPQVCVSSFDATAELADVLDELRTLPFLAPHRVVIVRDAESFVSANREALEKYFDAPAASATLILEVGAWPSNTKLAKKLKSVGDLVDCDSPEGAKLLGWIRAAVEQRGKTIAPDAAGLLADWIGPSLTTLSNELDKVVTYIGENPAITTRDVTAVVTSTAGPEAFAVTNALTNGDAKSALQATTAALQTRGAEFALLGQIAWHIRRAMQVAQDVAAGQNPMTAMKSARVFYGQREFQAMLRRRTLQQFQADFRKLIAADLGMKTGRDALPAMQQLVIELCH
ncbi:MAG: DNA polymerase III subunit delta [Phycisphaerae bacterium]|nr:DNA polymerase III subunit delta [Phycisphaerae bacterium]